MKTIRLIHWNAAEAQVRVAALEAAGYRVEYEQLVDQTALRRIREGKPVAIVIDLSRAPAQSRDMALWLRQQEPTRNVPLVLLDGEPEKVKRIKSLLPDATYSSWKRFRSAIKRAMANPLTQPVVPSSVFAGYSGTPLPKKLGIKQHSIVALVNAPPDFEVTLGTLPEGAVLRPSGRGRRGLTICFVRSRRELIRRIDTLVKVSEQGNVWIAWPKKASGVETDLTQTHVRQTGLDAGLVDYKICAIDETWSGLCFALRRS